MYQSFKQEEILRKKVENVTADPKNKPNPVQGSYSAQLIHLFPVSSHILHI